jgi:lysozyme family protein
MAKHNFRRALALTLRFEGGLSDHPDDPGGRTMKGVTQKVYDRWRAKRGKPQKDVAKITDDEVEEIYRIQYWRLVSGDDLPEGIDAAVFDYAVNSGAGRAIQDLQRVLGIRPDGNPGAVTIDAAMAADAEKVIVSLCARRLAFMQRLKTWTTFGRGWTRRVNAVQTTCLDMIEAPLRPAETAVMEFEMLQGGAASDELAAAPADPRAVGLMSTQTGKGAAIAGLGTAGAAVTDTAERISFIAEHSDALRLVFVLLVVAGIGLTVYSQVKSIREERPE